MELSSMWSRKLKSGKLVLTLIPVASRFGSACTNTCQYCSLCAIPTTLGSEGPILHLSYVGVQQGGLLLLAVHSSVPSTAIGSSLRGVRP